jgi:hypothetical protein
VSFEDQLRLVVGNDQGADQFIAEMQGCIERYDALNDFIDLRGDPRDIGDGLAAVARAADQLADAMTKLPMAGWACLSLFAPGVRVRIGDGSPEFPDQFCSGLPEELTLIAHIARTHSDQLKGVRRGTMYHLPNTTKAAYARNHQLIRDVIEAYRRHFGEPTRWVNPGKSKSKFYKIVDIMLPAAGCAQLSAKQMRNVIGELTQRS